MQGSLKGESGNLSQVAWGFSSMHPFIIIDISLIANQARRSKVIH